jgi:hypothetical protein
MADGLKRAFTAAADTRGPAKRWRVYGPRGISEDYRSERAAYEAVATIVRLGNWAKVYHWEPSPGGGSWKLFERIDAAPSSLVPAPKENGR